MFLLRLLSFGNLAANLLLLPVASRQDFVVIALQKLRDELCFAQAAATNHKQIDMHMLWSQWHLQTAFNTCTTSP